MVGAKRVAQTIVSRWNLMIDAEFRKIRVESVAALIPERPFVFSIWLKPRLQCRADFNQPAAASFGFRGGNGDVSCRDKNVFPCEPQSFRTPNPCQTLQRNNRAHGRVSILQQFV